MNTILNIGALLVACEKIEGRKKLQKLVYILQSMGYQRDFPHWFGYLHYGPYSHEVKADIDALVGPPFELVTEEENTTGLGHKTFTYSAKPGLVSVVESMKKEWAEHARALNQKNAQLLEAISTILFLERSGISDANILKERFDALKPDLRSLWEDARRDAALLPRPSAGAR